MLDPQLLVEEFLAGDEIGGLLASAETFEVREESTQ